MYPERAQPTGHHRFLHHNTSTYCPCQRCVHHELPYDHHGGPGQQPGSSRTTAHRGNYASDTETARTFAADRIQRSGYRSPQRRPVFLGPGPSGRSEDLGQGCPRELNPGPWIYQQECGVRRYPSVREQCRCVVRSDTRVVPFNAGMPHPLPHLQVKGDESRTRRTVRYAAVNKEVEETAQRHHSEPSHSDHLKPKGYCGVRSVYFEGGEERDIHQDRDRLKGGSEEVCNGHCESPKGFFATEVPQKHLSQRKSKGTSVTGVVNPEPSKPRPSGQNSDHPPAGSEVAKQKKSQDSVRDQIRQVVTDLEDVLGGLKQVHVEMKEVVEQIDRLTANIDLDEEAPGINQSASNNPSARPVDPRVASPPNRSAQVQGLPHLNEDRFVLRTNSPSPIHMASVVKTSCFVPATHRKEGNQERPGANGHPPHLFPNHIGPPESPPQTTVTPVITGNGNVGSKTQKPPPYPQNGRCVKGSQPTSKPLRTPAHPGRGRHTTSIV